MNALIVEKETIDLRRGNQSSQTNYALATSDRIPQSVCFSLTYEAHLTKWTPDRKAVEQLLGELTTA